MDLRAYYFGNLTANRVAFSAGRDLVLEPKQAGPPINFLIYPYAEAGGKPVPPAQIKKSFSYEDDGGKTSDKKLNAHFSRLCAFLCAARALCGKKDPPSSILLGTFNACLKS